MGAWGYGLYDDDIALDVKADYIKMLKSGIESTKATEKLIEKNRDVILDIDEAPVFWFALADIQWKKGVLEDKVKEKALYYLNSEESLKQWEDASPATITKRKELLNGLKERILSPQSAPKKISRPRQYCCEWKIGDTYAFPLLSDYAKEKGHYGQYFIFHKVGETKYYPDHIIPVVWVKITNGQELPTNAEEFNSLEYVQTGVTKYEDRFFPFSGRIPIEMQIAEKSKIEYPRDEFGHLPKYRLALPNSSKRIIPKSMRYLGNFQNVIPPKIEYIPTCELHIPNFAWKFLEKNLMDRYHYYNLRESPLYSKK